MSTDKYVGGKSSYADLIAGVRVNDATAYDFQEVTVDSENYRVVQYKSSQSNILEIYDFMQLRLDIYNLYFDMLIGDKSSHTESMSIVRKNDPIIRNFQKICVKSKNCRIVQPSSRKHQFSRK